MVKDKEDEYHTCRLLCNFQSKLILQVQSWGSSWRLLMAHFVLGLLQEWGQTISLQCCQDRNLSLRLSWCANKKDIFSFGSNQGTLTFNWWFTKGFVCPVRGRDRRKTQISRVSLIIYEIFFKTETTGLEISWKKKKKQKTHRNKIKERKWKLRFPEVR